MKLEVGKCYRTKGGRNTGPLREGMGRYTFVSPLISEANMVGNQVYNSDGSVWRMSSGEEGHVIVSEWIEGFEVGKTYRNTDQEVIVDYVGTDRTRAYCHDVNRTGYEFMIRAEDGWQLVPPAPVIIEQVRNVFYLDGNFCTGPEKFGVVGKVKFTLTDGKLSVEVVE